MQLHRPHDDHRCRASAVDCQQVIPMQAQIKSILNGLVVMVLVLWIANLYGVFDHLHQFRVGR